MDDATVRLSVLALWLILLAAPAAGQAQPAPLPEEPQLTLPVPLASVSYPLPAGLLGPDDQPARVLLQLALDAEGDVLDAAVAESSGDEAIDAAALEAALYLSFLPATQGGEPVAVTINYPLVFVPPAPPPPLVVPAELSGRVEVKGSKDPVPGMEVALLPAVLKADAEEREEPLLKDYEVSGDALTVVETDAEGNFVFADLPPGTYIATLGSGGYKLERFLEVLAEGTLREVVYRIRPTGVPETIVVARRQSDTPERVLTRDQLKKMPGAGRDPMAAVQSLPGVVHVAPDFAAGEQVQTPVLRGASAEDSVLYLDGLPVPIIFHSLSGYTITGDALVERAFLKPAAVEARYGDLTGGVVGLDLRSPRDDRVGGFIDPGIGMASFALEGPITEKSRFFVGLRRSYFDVLMKLIIPKDAPIDFATAPYFQDQQVLLELDATPWLTLTLGYIGTIDGIKLLREQEADDASDPLLFDLKTDMHRIFIKSQIETESGFRNRLTPAVTFWGSGFNFANYISTEDRHTVIHVVDDLHVPLGERVSVDVSGIFEADSLRQRRNIPAPVREDTGPRTSLPGEENLVGNEKEWRLWAGASLSVPVDIVPRKLRVTPEVRVDWWNKIQQAAPQVRGRIGFSPIDQLRFSVAGGRYIQSPSFEELSSVTGNPDLQAEGAWHLNGGVQWAPGPWLDIDVQGYGKWLDKQTVSSSSASQVGELASLFDFSGASDEDPTHGLSNSGIGRIYGVEAFARFGFLKGGVGIEGWLGYSLSWAQRKDFPDEEWRWFQHDRRHQITALIQASLPGEVSLGARWLFQSGNPITPVEDSIYYPDQDFYLPVYGDLYSARSRPFHQLDIRLDKRFRRKTHLVDIYIDVQNAIPAASGDFEIPSFDYRETAAFTMFPAINFAVRVEF